MMVLIKWAEEIIWFGRRRRPKPRNAAGRSRGEDNVDADEGVMQEIMVLRLV